MNRRHRLTTLVLPAALLVTGIALMASRLVLAGERIAAPDGAGVMTVNARSGQVWYLSVFAPDPDMRTIVRPAILESTLAGVHITPEPMSPQAGPWGDSESPDVYRFAIPFSGQLRVTVDDPSADVALKRRRSNLDVILLATGFTATFASLVWVLASVVNVSARADSGYTGSPPRSDPPAQDS